MIELITTVETIKQAEQLLAAGADTLYFGEEQLDCVCLLRSHEKNSDN